MPATLDMSCFNGSDGYSDGAEIEERLLEAVRAGKPPSLEPGEFSWPLYYHLSQKRRLLLEWYPFEPGAALLELGAGCGALTGLFCERVRRVVAAELSASRCRILHERWRACDNLEVVAGNMLDIGPRGEFDYATLIGVLEYARSFVKTGAPHAAMLAEVRRRLKPGGRLLLALENRFGLKYFAGAGEDHTGRPFESIECYPLDPPVDTFSKREIETLLLESGFSNLEFHYPHPDYKFPDAVFSDSRLPQGFELGPAPNPDRSRIRLFDESRAWARLVRDGMFPWFANSFLVVAEAQRGGRK
ncbi:MAG: class I SAM-dependent methyltransferase [Lentisphaerae bacterium]|nr:class I SAM-dependent methyltransferase [Lentisphaerota bacterium]